MPPKKKKRKPRARAKGGAGGAAAAPAPVERSDPQEKRRERLEARREAKAKAMAAQRRANVRARITRFVLVIGFLLFAFWFFFLRVQLPNSIGGYDIEDFRLFSAESRNNQLHTDADISYASSPPVSGEHSLQPNPCGLLATQPRDENMVHTLEHGAVGILYSPEVPLEEIKQIEALVSDFPSHTFSGPYQPMDTPVTMVAWGHLMRMDGYDEDAMREFIDVFREDADAPEQQDCDNTEDDAFDPDAAATPTAPAATINPTTAPSPKPTKN